MGRVGWEVIKTTGVNVAIEGPGKAKYSCDGDAIIPAILHYQRSGERDCTDSAR